MKRRVRLSLMQEAFDPKSLYKQEGPWQGIARHPVFETISLAVVAANALWMGIEADLSTSAVHRRISLVADNAFCAFFTLEWLVRFLAFKRKRDCLRDGWFVFDGALVSGMVLETWVVAGLGSGLGMRGIRFVRLARLLRLSRVARMVRIFRAVPELLVLIRGMAVAMRAVVTTFVLLVALLYVFALLFRQLTRADSVLQQLYFGSIPSSMYTLLVHGVFFDNLGAVTNAIGRQSSVALVLFWFFVLTSSLTVMNMLIGVILEAVNTVASAEKEAVQVAFVKRKLEGLFWDLDESGDGRISRREFMLLLEKPEAARLLQDAGVDAIGLVDQADLIFESDELGEGERELNFPEFLELVLRLRGSCIATVRDVVDLRRYLRAVAAQVEGRLGLLEERASLRGPHTA